ncbi:hypothetical protein LTR81_026820 [Elasticomyces elasticus]
MDLPAEIRNRNFEYAVTVQDFYTAVITSVVFGGRRVRVSDARQPPFTKVSRQLRRETLGIFYGIKTYALSCPYISPMTASRQPRQLSGSQSLAMRTWKLSRTAVWSKLFQPGQRQGHDQLQGVYKYGNQYKYAVAQLAVTRVSRQLRSLAMFYNTNDFFLELAYIQSMTITKIEDYQASRWLEATGSQDTAAITAITLRYSPRALQKL